MPGHTDHAKEPKRRPQTAKAASKVGRKTDWKVLVQIRSALDVLNEGAEHAPIKWLSLQQPTETPEPVANCQEDHSSPILNNILDPLSKRAFCGLHQPASADNPKFPAHNSLEPMDILVNLPNGSDWNTDVKLHQLTNHNISYLWKKCGGRLKCVCQTIINDVYRNIVATVIEIKSQIARIDFGDEIGEHELSFIGKNKQLDLALPTDTSEAMNRPLTKQSTKRQRRAHVQHRNG